MRLKWSMTDNKGNKLNMEFVGFWNRNTNSMREPTPEECMTFIKEFKAPMKHLDDGKFIIISDKNDVAESYKYNEEYL